MKKIILSIIVLIFICSCEQKKSEKTPNTDQQKTEVKTIEETLISDDNSKVFKTKTGKTFIVNEEKSSASLSKISITPKGFENSKDIIQIEESDPFDYALVADIDGNGFDELYIITQGAGSGSYANIYGFSSNNDKSVTPIYVPELSDDDFAALFKGYMGHDKFYVEGKKLLRKYPVYKKEDTNANPTGGETILEYKLKMGENSWILELKK